MSRPVDLMPAACRRRLRRKTERRRWITAYSAAGGAAVVIAAALQIRAAAGRAELDRLLRQVELDNDQAARIEALRKEYERVAVAIERHQAIAWPVPLSEVVSAIASAVPPAATLTGLTVTPVFERGKPGKQSEAIATTSSLTIELTGLAPTDLDVAALIAALEAEPLFDRVSIDHSRSTTVRGAEAREYGVTCAVDFAARRQRARQGQAAGAQEARVAP